MLKPGDVLLAIDDHPIASDAFVELEGERVEMPEVVERKFKGDKVKLDILRDKKPLNADDRAGHGLALSNAGSQLRCAASLRRLRRFAFSAVITRLIDAYQPSDLRVRHYFDYFVLEQIYLQHPEVIVLTNILPDPTNTYLAPYRSSIVDEVNGKKIRNAGRSGEGVRRDARSFCHQNDR